METQSTAAALFGELAEAGFVVGRIGELRRRDYRVAIPILLRWLPRVEDRYLQWAIVGALGTPWARPVAAPTLLALFREAPDDPCGFKWSIGAALGRVADESVWEELVPLVCDPRHGHARQMLVAAFGRMRRPCAVDVLLALLRDADAEIVEQALLALGRLTPMRARAHVVPLLGHDSRWVRRAARETLARIDRTRALRVRLVEEVAGERHAAIRAVTPARDSAERATAR